MDYSIPILIRQNKEHKEDYECICKYCQKPEKYVSEWDGYFYLYNYCMCCNKKVWYWHQVCSLYGRRSPFVVCFYCRIPFLPCHLKSSINME